MRSMREGQGDSASLEAGVGQGRMGPGGGPFFDEVAGGLCEPGFLNKSRGRITCKVEERGQRLGKGHR